jgi:hypothetical protein
LKNLSERQVWEIAGHVLFCLNVELWHKWLPDIGVTRGQIRKKPEEKLVVIFDVL